MIIHEGKLTKTAPLIIKTRMNFNFHFYVMCIMSDELINDFEQEYQFAICQGLRFKVEQDWPLLSVISKM